MKQVFQFRQVRDFGTVINHSFEFIKTEYKRLGKALLLYVLPVFIVTGIILVLTQISMVGSLTGSVVPGANMLESFHWGKLSITYLLFFLNFTVLATVVFSYLMTYLKKRGEFEVHELKASFLNTGVRILVANLVTGLLATLAAIFFVIPGIYLGVIFSLIGPIIVFEDASLGQALGRCFTVIKGNWWRTFGILIVGAVIAYIVGIVLSIPLMVSMAAKAFHAASNQTMPQVFSHGYFIFSTVTNLIQTFVWALFFIFISIQYFSLVEAKERPTLQEKIDRMEEDNA